MPAHLLPHVLNWLSKTTGLETGMENDGHLRAIAMRLRVPVDINARARGVGNALLNKAASDEEFCLDLVDVALLFWGQRTSCASELENILTFAGSVWTVASDRDRLQLAVDESAQATYEAAVAPQDEASTQLAEAWAKAFGRTIDPSDAWDHAIKAVEVVLIPVVCPNNSKATLGSVIGILAASQTGPSWKMVLPTGTLNYEVDSLVSMLRMIWPNPDRHGAAAPAHTPTKGEAQAVVSLAATLVQWARQGWIVQQR
ncbi:hypothetical protein TUM20983_27960 [Mycobacterium antarcticum]|uniref:hypothetical protein n=1 Tax=unclassified Mycolicibacterium TaxID=2636767 RepID=UPI002396513D|nr:MULTISPECIES: hypothetical protein [unclassified Mycolicibacterium]GLP75686.1 hypothetical protein TUM20983_27960 [Mycolicibacterium sp. TUM20983]GLP83971.1 hypothetical protein TUM20984_53910 [Mycolicibacterium sp. TUM20984]